MILPAGAINLHAADLGNWMNFFLSGGKGSEIRKKDFEMLVKKHVSADDLPGLPKNPFYGLGWMLADYWGTSLWHHTGHSAGYSASLSLFPEHNL
ncbi:hypothetical protein HDU92_008601, partial [Lobulomyces angularis]